MKVKFKSKNRTKKSNLSKIFFLTFFLILIFTSFLLMKFSKNISSSLLEISASEVNRATYRFITDKINNEIINTQTVSDILIIKKNKEDEILYVDFNLDKAYKVLDNVSNILTSAFKSMENGNITVGYLDEALTHDVDGMILSIPVGSALKNTYFYNIGPKVPVKINFIGSVLTNLKTKVTNYGLNNALVEVYVYIEFHNQIITPFKVEDKTLKYDAIIASMMVEGEVPNFYNGTVEKESSIYSKSIE